VAEVVELGTLARAGDELVKRAVVREESGAVMPADTIRP